VASFFPDTVYICTHNGVNAHMFYFLCSHRQYIQLYIIETKWHWLKVIAVQIWTRAKLQQVCYPCTACAPLKCIFLRLSLSFLLTPQPLTRTSSPTHILSYLFHFHPLAGLAWERWMNGHCCHYRMTLTWVCEQGRPTHQARSILICLSSCTTYYTKTWLNERRELHCNPNLVKVLADRI